MEPGFTTVDSTVTDLPIRFFFAIESSWGMLQEGPHLAFLLTSLFSTIHQIKWLLPPVSTTSTDNQRQPIARFSLSQVQD